MKTFRDYLLEAQLSDDNLARVLAIFQRRLPKLLGAPVYRNGDMYWFGKRAFRVDHRGGRVNGLEVWDRFALNRGPTHRIDVSRLSAETLIGAIGKVAALIKDPQVGRVDLTEALLEMAKRIDQGGFYALAKRTFSADQLKALTVTQIKQLAAEHDVLIPAYVWGQKVAKGLWSVVPPSEDGGTAEAPGRPPGLPAAAEEPKAKKKDPILFIKVTAQDPDTKRFMSADGPKAQALYTQLQQSLQRPTEAEVKDPETMYGHMAQLVDMACRGKLRSLLIYGGPGTGKTFTIMKTVADNGLVKGADYIKLSGKASPVEIYKTLFMYRKNGLVVFDDLDSMWGNEDATNILKAALDTSPVREISWISAQTINVSKMDDARKEALNSQIDRLLAGEAAAEEDPEDEDDEGGRRKKTRSVAGTPDKIKYPSSFDFKGRVIFISNLKKEQFDSAILSRSAKINMDLTPEQILKRMRAILPTLGGDDVPLKKKEELVDHLLDMHAKKEIEAVTMREFIKGLDIVRSGAPNWKELVQYA